MDIRRNSDGQLTGVLAPELESTRPFIGTLELLALLEALVRTAPAAGEDDR